MSAAADAATRRALIGANLAGLLIFLTSGVGRPVVAVYAAHTLNLSPGLVGAILSVPGAAAVLGVVFGSVIRRFGATLAMRVNGSLMFASALLYLLAHNASILVAAQLLAGIGMMGTWIGAQTYVTLWGGKVGLARVAGNFTFWTALGLTLGPLFGTFLLDAGGPRAGFVGYGLLSVLLIAQSILLPAAGRSEETAEAPRISNMGRWGRGLMQRPPIQAAFVFSSLGLFIVAIRNSFYLLFLNEHGLSASSVGVLIAASGAAATLVRPLMSVIAARFGMPALILAGSLTASAGLGLTPLAAGAYVPLLVLAVLNGLGAGLHQPVGIMLVAEATSPQERGVAMGLRSTVNQFSGSIAPLFFGLAVQHLGGSPAFYLLGMVGVMLGLWAWQMSRVAEREAGVRGTGAVHGTAEGRTPGRSVDPGD